MQMVVERIESRVGALKPPADTRQAVEQWLHELLPLDEERWAENEVWLAFAGRALVDSRLRARHEEVDEELRGACLGALQELDSAGRLRPGLDLELEAERLHGLAEHLARADVSLGWSYWRSLGASRTRPRRPRRVHSRGRRDFLDRAAALEGAGLLE